MRPLLRLYPRRWRRRYGLEMEAMLQRQPPGFRGRVDLIRGAIDARLHPQWSPWRRRRRPLPRLIGGIVGLAAAVALAGIAAARSTLAIRVFIVAAGALVLGCAAAAVLRGRRRGPGPEPPEGAPVAARPSPDPPTPVDAVSRRAG